jgi:transcription initiation factor IIE alpha subunit
MTAAVLDRPVSRQLDLDAGGTLEELLNRAFDDARENGGTECPVCHAHMSFTRAREAECGGCGSRLR